MLLIDRPSSITERRLAAGVLASAGWRFGAAAALVLASLGATLATSVLPMEQEVAVVAAGVVGALALLWPLLSPILEISSFSGAWLSMGCGSYGAVWSLLWHLCCCVQANAREQHFVTDAIQGR